MTLWSTLLDGSDTKTRCRCFFFSTITGTPLLQIRNLDSGWLPNSSQCKFISVASIATVLAGNATAVLPVDYKVRLLMNSKILAICEFFRLYKVRMWCSIERDTLPTPRRTLRIPSSRIPL